MSALQLAILTTDTPHHRHFLRELDRRKPDGVAIGPVLFETRGLPARRLARRHIREQLPNVWAAFARNPYIFMGLHAEAIRAYEAPRFFPDGDDSLPSNMDIFTVESVNSDPARATLEAGQPDLAFVYGTGLIHRDTFSIPRLDTVNAHGGLLPGYRGLDTNLWAALEGHPGDMAVALHRMDDDFDIGPVYLQRRLEPAPDLNLVSLRYHTTLLCTDMYLDLLDQFVAGTAEASEPEASGSRYYRPMPALLKRRADRAIRAYAAGHEGRA